MKNLFKVSALVLGLGLGFSQVALANRTTTNLGELSIANSDNGLDGVYKLNTFDINKGTFKSEFDFTAAVDSNLLLGQLSANWSDTVIKGKDIYSGTALNSVILYDDTTPNVASIQASTLGTQTTDTSHFSYQHLTVGHSYSLVVEGTGYDKKGNGFIGQIQVSPVPEAEEWAMMLLGLPLIGLVAKRRKSSATVIAA